MPIKPTPAIDRAKAKSISYNLRGSFHEIGSHKTDLARPNVSDEDQLRIRFSIKDMLLDGHCSLKTAQSRLYRDNPDVVQYYYKIAEASHDHCSAPVYDYGSSNHKTSLYRTKAQSGRPMFDKKSASTCLSKGMTVSDMASDPSLWLSDGVSGPLPSEETTRRLLLHHGWLELAPYGRTQSRSLATEKTIKGGYGQNIDPSGKHSIRLSGGARSFPFPVFWKERLPEVVTSLEWSKIISSVSDFKRKQERLSWLLNGYAYLPTPALSELSGMGTATVKRAKVALNAKPIPIQYGA